jgi:C-terminal peptidase prc
MTRSDTSLRKLIYIFLVLFFFLGGIRCQHLQGPVENKKEPSHRSTGIGEPGKIQEEIIKKVYNLILDNYINPLSASELVESAVKGMQNLLGTDRLSYNKTGKNFVIFSSGETVHSDDITGRAQGQEELIRIYSFIVRTNPQFDPLTISHAAMKKMADVDGLSGFISHDILKSMQEETRGHFEMVGANVGIKEQVLTVISTIEDSPAFRAGILPGDQIIMIDGTPTKGLHVTERTRRLRGAIGTPLTFTIMREGFPNPRDFTLIRDVVPVWNVRYKLLENHYGYIRIFQFGENTDIDCDRGLKALEEKSNRGVMGLILDLRNNQGGLLNQAVKVADLFLESGLVCSIHGRSASQKMSYYARREGTVPPYPLIILVNE